MLPFNYQNLKEHKRYSIKQSNWQPVPEEAPRLLVWVLLPLNTHCFFAAAAATTEVSGQDGLEGQGSSGDLGSSAWYSETRLTAWCSKEWISPCGIVMCRAQHHWCSVVGHLLHGMGPRGPAAPGHSEIRQPWHKLQ